MPVSTATSTATPSAPTAQATSHALCSEGGSGTCPSGGASVGEAVIVVGEAVIVSYWSRPSSAIGLIGQRHRSLHGSPADVAGNRETRATFTPEHTRRCAYCGVVDDMGRSVLIPPVLAVALTFALCGSAQAQPLTAAQQHYLALA